MSTLKNLTHPEAWVIIVSAGGPLLDNAIRSLERFAPTCQITVPKTAGKDAREHAAGIEEAREWLHRDEAVWNAHQSRPQHVGQVILFDDDAVVLSEQWLTTLRGYHDKGYSVVGGIKHRADITQVVVDGVLIPHAHCLSFTRQAFDAAATFHADLPRYDTAALACLQAAVYGSVLALPFTIGTRPYHDLPVGVYRHPETAAPLWAHLGRGTSFAPRSSLRERVRRVAAQLGSKRAQKILRRQDLRARFIERTKEVLA